MDELIKQLYAALEHCNNEATGALCCQIIEAISSKPKDIRQAYYEETLHGLIMEYYRQVKILQHPDKADMHTYIEPKQDKNQQRGQLLRLQDTISYMVETLARYDVKVSKDFIQKLKSQGVQDYDLLWRFSLTMEDIKPIAKMQLKDATEATKPRGRKPDTIHKYVNFGKEANTLAELYKALQGKQGAEQAKVYARFVYEGKLTKKPSWAAANRFVTMGCQRQSYSKDFDTYLNALGSIL